MLIQSSKTSPPIPYYIGKERVGGNTNDTSATGNASMDMMMVL